jgi:hypothetical protein
MDTQSILNHIEEARANGGAFALSQLCDAPELRGMPLEALAPVLLAAARLQQTYKAQEAAAAEKIKAPQGRYVGPIIGMIAANLS